MVVSTLSAKYFGSVKGKLLQVSQRSQRQAQHQQLLMMARVNSTQDGNKTAINCYLHQPETNLS